MSGISADYGRDHFDTFVQTEGPELLRFAFLLTAGAAAEAEDIVQAVLMRLVDRGVDDLAEPRTYARRAVINEWYSMQRRAAAQRRALARAADRVDFTQPGPEDRDAVLKALTRLTERERTVIVLRYYEDLTDVEIAAALGCRRGTVRSLVHRAVPKLRAHLESSFGGTAGSAATANGGTDG